MYCRNCGKEVQPQDKVCVSCGSNPNKGINFCHNCGSTTDPSAEVCNKCGAKLGKYIPPNSKSRVVAGVLGIFLGGFGIHRFYLGYSGIGLIQLIVTILSCGIGYVWGFIEGVLILTGNINKDAAGNDLVD